MFKIIYILILFTSISYQFLFCQSKYDFGIKLGFTSTNMYSEYFSEREYHVRRRSGFIGGSFLNIKNINPNILIELLYLQRGNREWRYGFLEDGTTEYSENHYNLIHYISLPISIKANFNIGRVNLYFLQGSYINIFLKHSDYFKEDKFIGLAGFFFNDDPFHPVSFGYSGGIGILLTKNIILDTRYCVDLTDICSFDEFITKTNGFDASLGYIF